MSRLYDLNESCQEICTMAITITYHFIYEPFTYISVDCIWDEWTPKGKCSESCGQGQQLYTRIKIRDQNSNGKCEGNSMKVISCNEGTCPGNTTQINFVAGILLFSFVFSYSIYKATILFNS